MRNERWGLECSTSLYSQVNCDFGFLESIILTAVTNSPIFALGPAAVSAATTILTGLATTAIVVGANALLTPKPPKPSDGKAPKVQAIPNRIWAVGTNRIAGNYMLWETDGDTLYGVIALVGHLVHSIHTFYLQDDIVTLDENGNVQELSDGRYGGDRVFIDTRLGAAANTAYAPFVDALSDQDVYTNDHKLNGTASLAISCKSPGAKKYQKIFPYGIPQPSAVIDCALVYDWRDAEQSRDDPSTWKFSKNSALILAWHLCDNRFGYHKDFDTAILPVIDMWTEEANVCDETVTRAAGGSEPRYECHGWTTTDRNPKEGLNSILASCDGWLCSRGDGAILFVAGKFREKYVATISDEDIAGYTIQSDVAEEDEINRLVPRFTYPATDYTDTDTDFWEDIDAQLKTGQVLTQEADFSWVQSWTQARRLGLREFKRIREKKHGTLDVRLSGINAAYARWIKVNSTYRVPRLDGMIIENRKSSVSIMKGGFTLQWRPVPTDIDAWDPETDEGSAPPVPPKPTIKDLSTPVIDSVVAVSNGSSVYLRVTIDELTDDSVIPAVRYRIHDIGGGTAGNWIEQDFSDFTASDGLIALNTNPVPDDQLIDVEVAAIGSKGSYSEWSASTQVTSTVDPTAPEDLLTFSAADGTGQFIASFGTTNDSHLAKVAIYKVPSGDPLDRGADLAAEPAVAPGVSYSIPVTSDAGTFDIYAEPLNVSGIAGTLEGPATVTVS